MVIQKYVTLPGESAPLGATPYSGGVSFSIYSRSATSVTLHFFNHVNDDLPSSVFKLDPHLNHTYHYWHVFVPGASPGQIYGYSIDGPRHLDRPTFDPEKLLIDPYGREIIVPKNYSRAAASAPGRNAGSAMKSVVVDASDYDWEGDRLLRHSPARTIIYEMHVRGFTQNSNSGVAIPHRGTYAGVIEKIPYLRELGITAIELLPVFQFDAQDCPLGATNYWGYAPIGFFSPHRAYSANQDPMGPTNEFRDMVKQLHRAGIEVILDVVFNHTAEGSQQGPTLSFRGIDDATYYIHSSEGKTYANYSGCGNTLNADNPIVRRLVLDSLRYWVREMHVDGFRFDLASVLSRDSCGCPLPNPAVIWDIESDPALAGIKLIAEAWDAGGLYQVGRFVGDSWREWNGRFRDDVRDYVRGEPGVVRRLADRILGSPDVYAAERREAEQSVNFVTCHDGFTLNDLVSYNNKHNEVNGEENRDGANDNRSWNCGVEGPTQDLAIEQLRERQIKNFLTINVLAIGVPMLLMGDEVRRTQHGNNNAYCHDDESTWFDWSLLKKNSALLRFVRYLLQRRSMRTSEHETTRTNLTEMLSKSRTTWHGTKLNHPDWSDQSRSIALNAEFDKFGVGFHFMLNAYWKPLDFELPPPPANKHWRLWIDTHLPSPNDICPWDEAPEVHETNYVVEARSVVMLFEMIGNGLTTTT